MRSNSKFRIFSFRRGNILAKFDKLQSHSESLMAWLASHRIIWMPFLALIIVGLAIIQRFYNAGVIGGLDYTLFQPDGFYYSIRTYEFLGHSRAEAVEVVQKFYDLHGKTGFEIDLSNGFQDKLMDSRVLYPLLSVVFVFFFGMWGMLIIPCLATIVFCIHFSVTAIGEKKKTSVILGILLLLSISTTFNRWMILNYTEALNFLLFYFLINLFSKTSDKDSKLELKAIFLFALISLNHAEPLISIAFVTWAAIYKVFSMRYFVLFFIIFLNTIPLLLNGIRPLDFQDSPRSLTEILRKAIELPLIEGAQLLILDRALLFLIALGLLGLFLSQDFKMFSLLIFLFLGSWIQLTLVGASGTNFRYFLPALPVLVLGFSKYRIL